MEIFSGVLVFSNRNVHSPNDVKKLITKMEDGFMTANHKIMYKANSSKILFHLSYRLVPLSIVRNLVV